MIPSPSSIVRPAEVPLSVAPGLILGDILRRAAAPERFGGKTALIWGAERLTYGQLNASANRAAHALQDLGVRRGDRVAVLARNCPEYVWLYFALAKLGAVLVPINFWYRSAEIEYTLRQSRSTTLLLDERFWPQAETALQSIGTTAGEVRRIVVWNRAAEGSAEGAGGAGALAAGALQLEALVSGAPEGEPDVPVTAADQHIILYTSGTTGFPKGATFSQGAHALHAMAWALMTGQHADDVGLLVYPLFHTGGPDCVLLPHFLVGGTVVLLDGADPEAMLQAIAGHRVTNVFCVPTVWRRLLAALQKDQHDVSSVRRCLGSSDTLPAELLDGLLDHFDAEVYVTYGLTEAGCILTYNKLTRQERETIHSVGQPHPLVEVRIAPLPMTADGTGEVIARGPTLMDGYWELPERTAEALSGGWLHTGDLGRFDAQGNLYLAGRSKDMIVTGGEKVYPLEVERLLRTLPGIGDVALVGVPDPDWGESVLACVVRAPGPDGQTLTAGDIQGFARRQLAGYKCPRYVEFVEVLPTTSATAKVQKGVLRERFRERYQRGAEQ
ncbi:MAG: AMP-binding protein [Chloroflexota bacterium]|nr:AMP-binding protein [Chloroflexota bacterium]